MIIGLQNSLLKINSAKNIALIIGVLYLKISEILNKNVAWRFY